MLSDPDGRQCGLSEEVLALLDRIFGSNTEVESVILYGSRAKAAHRPGSDVDIVITGEGVTNSVLARIESEIDDLLLPYTFDVSSFALLDKAELLCHINRVGVVIYQRG